MRDNLTLPCSHPSASGGYCLVYLLAVSPPFALSVLGQGKISWVFWALWLAVVVGAAYHQMSLSAQWVFDGVAREAQQLLTSATGTEQARAVPFDQFLQVVVQGQYSNSRNKAGPDESFWTYTVVCLFRDGERTDTLTGSQTYGQPEFSVAMAEAERLGRLLEVPVLGQRCQVYRPAEDRQSFVLDERTTAAAYPPHEGGSFVHDLRPISADWAASCFSPTLPSWASTAA